MINQIIQKREMSFGSDSCQIKDLISYMTKCAFLRDAQIEAIKPIYI